MLASLRSRLIRQTSPTCPLCGGTSVRLRRIQGVYKCMACGMWFRHPPPSEGQVVRLYEDSWQDASAHSSETGAMTVEAARLLVEDLFRILALPGPAGLRLMDSGAGKGTLAAGLPLTVRRTKPIPG